MASWLTEKPIAHRGWHWEKGVDENSFEAFEIARDKEAPIELDVHLSRDGVPYVHHDLNLLRMTGKDIIGTKLPASDLQAVLTENSSRGIPLLKEVLELVDSKVPLVIEIKKTESSPDLERAVLSLLESYKGEFSLQSFHPQSLIILKKEGRGAPIGILSGPMDTAGLNPVTRVMIKSLCLVPYIRPQYIGYQWDHLNQRAPQEIRKKYDIPLLGWTVKDERAAAFCKKWGDNIIFEHINY